MSDIIWKHLTSRDPRKAEVKKLLMEKAAESSGRRGTRCSCTQISKCGRIARGNVLAHGKDELGRSRWEHLGRFEVEVSE